MFTDRRKAYQTLKVMMVLGVEHHNNDHIIKTSLVCHFRKRISQMLQV